MQIRYVWRHKRYIKWCEITNNWLSVQTLNLQVEILQGWCTATATHFLSGYDVTTATYSLLDLYLPKMKTALFVAPEFNRLSCACAL